LSTTAMLSRVTGRFARSLFSARSRRGPESGVADGPRVLRRRVFFHGRPDRRSLSNQHEDQILRWEMLLDHLARDFRRHRIETGFKLIHLVVAESVEFVRCDDTSELPRCFDIRWKLALDVAPGGLKLLVGHAVFVKLGKNLKS